MADPGKGVAGWVPPAFQFGGPGVSHRVAHADVVAASTAAIAAAVIGLVIPTGASLDFNGTSIPAAFTGIFLMEDGSAVSRTTYAALFAVIGTTFGAGDGSTTFNVPDKRGRSSVGAGTGAGLTNRVLGAVGGEEGHQLTIAEMPSHNHPVPATTNSGGGANFTEGVPFGSTDTSNMGTTGGGAAHNTMPPFLVRNSIIKT